MSQFSRFLEVAGFSQGEMLSDTAIGREAGISRKTIVDYFEMAVDLLLGLSTSRASPRVAFGTSAKAKFNHPWQHQPFG